MDCIKIEFEKEIPPDEEIKSWIDKVAIFYTTELVIIKNANAKTIIADFGGIARDFAEQCEDFRYDLSEKYEIKRMFALGFPDDDAHDHQIFAWEGCYKLVARFNAHGFVSLSPKEKCRTLKLFGFTREYIRFVFIDEEEISNSVVVDNRLSDDYFIKVLGKEQAAKLGIKIK